ncbi:MAG: hypothetical protein JO016_10660 [Actinobacteria bacterium]|nr:hypothetical protein [Actinomycetota bacterium]
MFVLLSDGAGLTSRQCATLLAAAGHRVEALSPQPLCLSRLTRHVRAVHRVPGLGADPRRWLDAALDVATRRGAELLLPVQEQVTVMSLERERIAAAGLLTAVPDFAALRQVQDKVSAFRTLDRLGLPQPLGQVVTSRETLKTLGGAPVFVKTPIGTASAGTWRITSPSDLARLADRLDQAQLDWQQGVLVQQPAAGPLVMVQSVFARGELIAFHACERIREGASGGSSHKRGLTLPAAREHLAALGRALGWHGALSADVILTGRGPLFIDVNPRLVEPANAYQSGVDLTATLVEVARSGTAPPQPDGRAGVRTHQGLLAVLGEAARTGHRRDVARELAQALTRTGPYWRSTEELTPLRWPAPSAAPAQTRPDLVGAAPYAAAAVATLLHPPAGRRFVSGATSAYSLTPAAWQVLTVT